MSTYALTGLEVNLSKRKDLISFIVLTEGRLKLLAIVQCR